jgi:hypothetical protein
MAGYHSKFYGVVLYNFNDTCLDLSAKSYYQAKLEYQIKVIINYIKHFFMSEHIFEISTSHFSFRYDKPKSLNIIEKEQDAQKVIK